MPRRPGKELRGADLGGQAASTWLGQPGNAAGKRGRGRRQQQGTRRTPAPPRLQAKASISCGKGAWTRHGRCGAASSGSAAWVRNRRFGFSPTAHFLRIHGTHPPDPGKLSSATQAPGEFSLGFDEHGRRDRDAGVVTRTALAYTAATRPSAHGQQQQQQQRLSQQQQLVTRTRSAATAVAAAAPAPPARAAAAAAGAAACLQHVS